MLHQRVNEVPKEEGVETSRLEYLSQFRIEIRNCQSLQTGESTSLWKYEEWQFTGSSFTETARISTVLFRQSKQGYNGVEWVHVHETWMPGKGPS